jgi:hypothetical protein
MTDSLVSFVGLCFMLRESKEHAIAVREEVEKYGRCASVGYEIRIKGLARGPYLLGMSFFYHILLLDWRVREANGTSLANETYVTRLIRDSCYTDLALNDEELVSWRDGYIICKSSSRCPA